MPELDEREKNRPDPSDPTKQPGDRDRTPGSSQADQEQEGQRERDQSEVEQQGGRDRGETGQNPDRSPNLPE